MINFVYIILTLALSLALYKWSCYLRRFTRKVWFISLLFSYCIVAIKIKQCYQIFLSESVLMLSWDICIHFLPNISYQNSECMFKCVWNYLHILSFIVAKYHNILTSLTIHYTVYGELIYILFYVSTIMFHECLLQRPRLFFFLFKILNSISHIVA